MGVLPRELAKAGITTMEDANRYIKNHYMGTLNEEFMVKATEEGSAFIPYKHDDLLEQLCEKYVRVVGKDNCVQFAGLTLQIPVNKYRHNYVKVRVQIRRYWNNNVGIYHGPRLLATYDTKGEIIAKKHAA